MIIRIKPYYCPHCNKFKNRSEVYKTYGTKPLRSKVVMVEGFLPFCKGCDSPVEEVKPIVDELLFKVVEKMYGEENENNFYQKENLKHEN